MCANRILFIYFHFFYFLLFSGYSMSQWISAYRPCKQDRVHHFRCRLGPAIYSSRNCYWTPHVLHNVKHSFFDKCPNNGFITGVISYFDKTAKDRKYASALDFLFLVFPSIPSNFLAVDNVVHCKRLLRKLENPPTHCGRNKYLWELTFKDCRDLKFLNS